MSFLFVRKKEDVCRDRAKADADAKFDELILSKREEFSGRRRPELMQAIIKLTKEKGRFKTKAYEHHMNNYIRASDSISDKTPGKDRLGLKRFSNYLTEELNKI